MRLTTKGRYAVTAMLDLALHAASGPVTLADIAARQGISQSYLEQLFGKLKKAGLVVSLRGPGGGYALAQEPAAITLRRVIEAVEGPLAEGLVAADAAPGRSALYRPGFLWPQLATRLAGCLEELSLADLCRHAAEARVERAEREGPMYFI